MNGKAVGLEAIYNLQDARINAFSAVAGQERFGTTYGSKRTNSRVVRRDGLPRTGATAFALDATRQASCSSTSTRKCNGARFPKSNNGSGATPAAANSPARTSSFRISPSIGAVTRLRAISVSLTLMAASACVMRARSVGAAKRWRVELIEADDFLPGECLGAAELVFEVGQLGAGYPERSTLELELCAQMSVVDFEERVSDAYMLARADEDLLDNAGDVRADSDVFRASLDEPDAGCLLASPRSRSKTLSARSFLIRERSAWKLRSSMRSSDGNRHLLDMLTSAFFRNK